LRRSERRCKGRETDGQIDDRQIAEETSKQGLHW